MPLRKGVSNNGASQQENIGASRNMVDLTYRQQAILFSGKRLIIIMEIIFWIKYGVKNRIMYRVIV